MTAAGWHPDPHGRADRRYHDGSRWTEHVTDAAGTTSIDPPGAGPVETGPAPGLVIGPPPPRRPAGPPPAPSDAPAADPQSPETFDPPRIPAAPEVPAEAATHARPALPEAAAQPYEPPRTTAPGDEAATDARPALAKGPPPATRDQGEATQTIRPGDLDLPPVATGEIGPSAGADATAVIRPEDLEPESTTVIRPDQVGARPADATQVSRIPSDLLGAEATGPIPAGAADAPAGPEPRRRRGRGAASPGGVVLAVLGVLTGLVSLLLLPWIGGRTDASFLDLRRVVVDAGPDIGVVPISLLVTGALFGLVVGGITAGARALGLAPVRYAAAGLVVLATAGLVLVGLSSTDPGGAQADDSTPTTQAGIPGEVVVDDAGVAVLDDEGVPVTVPEADPTEALDQAAGPADDAADRLDTASLVGAALMGVTGLLALAGLLVRRQSGHTLASMGLAVTALWTVVGVGGLARNDQLGDLGNGAFGFVVATIALAVAAALPASDPGA